ncbi:hypothetical protein [Burkholderia ubonensis]|uniref:hypothetical protein n=1 Tax=Burkholderia ubonensis TaxID=101571 RepID=UPI0018DF77A5|nr:hypothetical protein [Burkholderia ubonensis]
MHTRTVSFLRFMDWADGEGYVDALDGGAGTYGAFRGYVDFLREKVNQHRWSQASATKEQGIVQSMLSGMTGVHDLHCGVNLLSMAGASWNATEPPSEDEVAKVESLCEALFLGFSTMVLEGRPYPFCLEMPKYLRWRESRLWVFPVQRWCCPPHLLENRRELTLPYWAYDYGSGRIVNPEEIREHYRNLYTARWMVENAQKTVSRANADLRHLHRIKRAVLAHNAFFVLFLGQTGLNLSVARSFRWDADYEVGTAQQGFREIKWRAGGKAYSAVIRLGFLPLFRRFIELRTYILGGRSCKSLFVNLGVNWRSKPGPIRDDAATSVLRTLSLIDPSISSLGSRQLRAAKQDFHIRNSEPAIAAKIMGHTEQTAIRLYSAGSKSVHYQEISAYYDRVRSTVASTGTILPDQKRPRGGKVSHVGLCTKFDRPYPIVDQAPIKPDCGQPEGCLFCDKHRIHADERDTRKLASCRYVVEQAMHIPGAAFHLQPVIDRIDEILADLRSLGATTTAMVERVYREVHRDGELDAYWAQKLTLLYDLELVI